MLVPPHIKITFFTARRRGAWLCARIGCGEVLARRLMLGGEDAALPGIAAIPLTGPRSVLNATDALMVSASTLFYITQRRIHPCQARAPWRARPSRSRRRAPGRSR